LASKTFQELRHQCPTANEVAVTDDTPDVLGPVPVEALTGLLIGAPTAGVSHLLNKDAEGIQVQPEVRSNATAGPVLLDAPPPSSLGCPQP
jgi:hypothetical protein